MSGKGWGITICRRSGESVQGQNMECKQLQACASWLSMAPLDKAARQTCAHMRTGTAIVYSAG